MALLNERLACTDAGASGEVAGIFDDEPMCMHTTVEVSSQACQSGSQCSLSWIEGRPRWYGISENASARTPRSALRRTSAAAATGSQSGTMVRGMRRPPVLADHSSTIQSLYAVTQRE